MKVKLTHFSENPVLCIEEAASNCYKSKITDGKIALDCYKSGHHSTFEFCDFTFHIEDISRACLAQLTRHRMASYNVLSQRYVGMENFGYVTPLSISEKNEVLERYKDLMDRINDFYKYATDNGIEKEDARYSLPNSCCTTLEMKINGRSLINFMNLRLCSRAQSEIRELAMNMKMEIIKIVPDFSRYLVPKCESNLEINFCTEKNCCGKHQRLLEIIKKT